jgi:hypothetical protein
MPPAFAAPLGGTLSKVFFFGLNAMEGTPHKTPPQPRLGVFVFLNGICGVRGSKAFLFASLQGLHVSFALLILWGLLGTRGWDVGATPQFPIHGPSAPPPHKTSKFFLEGCLWHPPLFFLPLPQFSFGKVPCLGCRGGGVCVCVPNSLFGWDVWEYINVAITPRQCGREIWWKGSFDDKTLKPLL